MEIPQELINKHPNVPEKEIYEAIEIATIRYMQTLHDKAICANYSEDRLNVYLLAGNQERQVDLSKLRRRNKRKLLDEIEIELMKRQACHESREYRSIRGSVFTGTVDRIKKDGSLIVMLQFNDVIRSITIYANYPVSQQPTHERGLYRAGDSITCMVVSCLPVSNGNHAKVRTIVSRVARELPSIMIAKLTGLTGIRCTKRIPGGYSRIISKYPLPKTEVNKVGKELKEHIEITCLNNPGKPFIYNRRSA